MLPALPKLPFEARNAFVDEPEALPLREGVADMRPRSRGWRTVR